MQKVDPKLVAEIVSAILNQMEADEKPEPPEGYVTADSVKAYKSLEDYPDSLGAKEISAILNISKARAYEVLHSKKCQSFVIMGRSKRVLKDDFIDFIKESRYGGRLTETGEDGDEACTAMINA